MIGPTLAQRLPLIMIMRGMISVSYDATVDDPCSLLVNYRD